MVEDWEWLQMRLIYTLRTDYEKPGVSWWKAGTFSHTMETVKVWEKGIDINKIETQLV